MHAKEPAEKDDSDVGEVKTTKNNNEGAQPFMRMASMKPKPMPIRKQ
jgi:hypothetical protein